MTSSHAYTSLVFVWSYSNIIAMLLSCVALYYFTRKSREDRMFDSLPGPKPLPIVGNGLQFLGPPEDVSKAIFKLHEEYKEHGLVRLWMGNIKLVYPFTADGFEVLLRSQEEIEKSQLYEYVRKWLCNGLITSHGSVWHSRRKLLTYAFHFKILERFFDTFNEQSVKLVSKMKEISEKEKLVDIYSLVTYCNLDIIYETALGVPLNAQDSNESPYVRALEKMASIFFTRFMKPWLGSNFVWWLTGYDKMETDVVNVLHAHSSDAIKERRKQLELLESSGLSKEKQLGEKQKLAFLDLLLLNQETCCLKDEEIREEVDTFMFAGHDTTSTAVSFCIFLLGCYPEKQEKVYEELDVIFGDDNRFCTIEDTRRMTYLDCCIKESARVYNPVPFFSRKLRDDVVIEGHTVPKDTNIMFYLSLLHHNPKYFSNPKEFEPERFMDTEFKERHPYSYVPFSAGPRNCIGQRFAMLEEKVVLSTILRNFKVESQLRRDQMKTMDLMILRPKGRIDIKISSRK